MAEAKEGSTVKVHYTGKLEDGTVFDSSEGRDPIEFTVGAGQIIPGFENGVTGMKPGDKKTVEVTADDAYGPRNEQMIQEFQKSELPPDLELEEGMQLQAQGPNNQPLLLTVAEVRDESVLLDANHPLAGKDLTFEIELLEVA